MNRPIVKAVCMLLLVAAALLTVVSCAKPREAKLTVWINGADSLIGPSEQQKPQNEWYISQAFERFKKANKGVTIELIVPPNQGDAHTNFKTAAVAGNAPDMANLWTGQPIFAMKEVLLPLDKLVPADDLKKIVGWESVRDGFKPDGTILGYPAAQNQICFMLYNKAIVKKAGMDWDANPPRTIEEFDAALAKIKAIGVTPITVDEAAEGVPWFFAWVADYWWVQQTGSENIIEQTYGRKKFAEDVGFIATMKYYQQMYKKGYFRKDMATSTDSFAQFLQGKAAIRPSVTSFLADAEKTLGDDCGVLLPPDFVSGVAIQNSTVGGPGQSFVVPKNTKFPELAVKLMSFLNSRNEVLEAQKMNRWPVVRNDMTPAEMGWEPGSNIAKLHAYSTNYVYWVDNLLTAGPANVYYPKMGLVGVGRMTPEALAEEMDKAAVQ